MNYVVATIKSWNIENFEKLRMRNRKNRWFLISKNKDLTLEKIKKINPRYIFFPHWSWIIPPEIYENFECVVFHMTDLPYGRGGSPLQNLIVRGKTKTKVSAIRVAAGLDAGPIYFKKSLGLAGSAAEIFRRLSKITFSMIFEMIKKEIIAKPQRGEPLFFKRRTPEESDISDLRDIQKVYDYIRMLDAEGYPAAFLEKNGLRMEFSKAKLGKGEVFAAVKIKIKK